MKFLSKTLWYLNPRLIFLSLMILAMGLAWWNRFIQDDAFISFTYARNLVQGEGLTWFGTRIEGYTNFLWVLWIALGMLIHVDPVFWAQAGGMVAYAVTLFAIWRVAYLISGGYTMGGVAILLLATNYTVLSYATGGLETMLQAALLSFLLLQYYQVENQPYVSIQQCLLASFLATAAILTRLDSALPCLLIAIAFLVAMLRKSAQWKLYVSLFAPTFLILGTWLVWKAFYYGRIFPNSAYAKLGWDVSVNVNGFVYLGRFFHWYAIWPAFVLGLFAMLALRIRPNRKLALPLSLVTVWFFYIVAVGGDFMEFRFLVPVAPMLFLILAYLVVYPIGQLWATRPTVISAILVGFLACMSFVHAHTFKGITDDKTLDSIPALNSFYGINPNGDWTTIGKRLREDLGDSSVLLAMNAVGAIPFYSELNTVDMWGLNDRVIAETGDPAPKNYLRPGHRRHTTLQYLKDRKVNLILADLTLIPRGAFNNPYSLESMQMWLYDSLPSNKNAIGTATLVAMPIGKDSELVMWYLTPSPELDHVISVRGWSKRLVLQ